MTDTAPIVDEEEEFKGETKSSRRWLAQIEDAEKAFEDWQKKADSIDKLYANLEKLSGDVRVPGVLGGLGDDVQEGAARRAGGCRRCRGGPRSA